MAIYHRYIVLGAGPGGLQMGYFMEKGKKDYLILEGQATPAWFFKSQPRHRTLLSINKRYNPYPEFEYNFRHDWNSLISDDPDLLFKNYSKELYPHADDLVRYMEDFAKKTNVKIQYNTWVSNIEKIDGKFNLKTKDGKLYQCDVLFMATGAVSERLPDIPGIELADTYSTHDLDQEKYAGQTLAIIGRGNSAMEVANHLAGHASVIHIMAERSPKFAWNTHFVGDIRAINNTILDMYQLKSIHAFLGKTAKQIRKNEKGELVIKFDDLVLHWPTPGTFTFEKGYDNVIVCTGFNQTNLSLFAESCKPETILNGKSYSMSPSWESTNINNLYYIGTNMQAIDKRAASGFIHGFRYNIRTLYHMICEKIENIPYPMTRLPLDLDVISKKFIGNAGTGSSIYQMNGVLSHVAIFPDDPNTTDENPVQYLEDIPIPYVETDERFTKVKHLFTMVLAYRFERFGEGGKNAVSWVHAPDFSDLECQAFLRPIFFYYNYGKQIDEVACPEHLLLRFDAPAYMQDIVDIKYFNVCKNYLNKHTNVNPGVHYREVTDLNIGDVSMFGGTFTPLTDEEMTRLPDGAKIEGCKAYTLELKEK